MWLQRFQSANVRFEGTLPEHPLHIRLVLGASRMDVLAQFAPVVCKASALDGVAADIAGTTLKASAIRAGLGSELDLVPDVRARLAFHNPDVAVLIILCYVVPWDCHLRVAVPLADVLLPEAVGVRGDHLMLSSHFPLGHLAQHIDQGVHPFEDTILLLLDQLSVEVLQPHDCVGRPASIALRPVRSAPLRVVLKVLGVGLVLGIAVAPEAILKIAEQFFESGNKENKGNKNIN